MANATRIHDEAFGFRRADGLATDGRARPLNWTSRPSHGESRQNTTVPCILLHQDRRQSLVVLVAFLVLFDHHG
jgi:hypothetical protein